MKTKHLCVLALVVFLVTQSCQKTGNTSSQSSNEQLRTQLMDLSNFMLQAENLDASAVLDLTSTNNSVSSEDARTAASACKTITNDPSTDVYPHTRTIVLNNCTSCDGQAITGTKVTVFYVDPAVASPGALLSEETYTDLVIDGAAVSANVKTYLVQNLPLVLHIVSTKSLQQTGSDGGKRNYTSDRTWTRILGDATPSEDDDVYSITGSETGKEILHGGLVAADVTSATDNGNPVIRANSCCHFTQGSETITVNVKSHGGYTLTEVLDYGSGTCDDQATLSINGGTAAPVTIPLRFFPLNE